MQNLLAALMGVIEGLTEFLPISSTGHLVLATYFSGFTHAMGEKFTDAFTIIIQLGAILAIVAAYPRRFTGLLRWNDNRGFQGLRGIGLLLVTTIPASIVGFLTHHFIKDKLFHPIPVATALAVGAIWILATERWRPKPRVEGVDSLTWREALSIGVFQCFSLWPGMSRAASTILGGMISGVERKTATEYSFFAAVPIMVAATAFELRNSYKDLAGHFDIVAIGFVVSFIVAWLAVKGFIWFLGRYTLVPFGWYRLALAAVVFWGALKYGESLM
ncbi:MAG: undecaprenyl-diphosphate phosphatase [Thermoguttaceae bacterium]